MPRSTAPGLFAYGGTAHETRNRIGEWPAVPSLVLASRSARTFYGAGILGDRTALVFRELQNPEHRGGYPYILLLDPGEPVWERAGWNPARLATALLFDEGNAPAWRMLRLRPELGRDALRSLLQGLELIPDGDAEEPIAVLEVARALCACALLQRDGPRTWIDPTTPSLEVVAAAIDLLPRGLRLGVGWAIGATLDEAEALGCHLLLGLAKGHPEERVLDREHLRRGDVLRKLAVALTRDPSLAPRTWEALQHAPQTWVDPPGAVLDVVEAIGALVDKPYAEAAEQAARLVAAPTAVAADLEALLGRWLQTRSPSSPALLKAFVARDLRRRFASLGPLRGAEVDVRESALDEGELAAALVDAGLGPQDLEVTDAELRVTARPRLWRRVIELEPQREKVPALLRRGIVDLRPGAGDSGAGPRAAELVAGLARATPGNGLELVQLRDALDAADPSHDPLRALVRDVARERVGEGTWNQGDLLASEPDEGGWFDRSVAADARQLDRVVRAVASARRDRAPHDRFARWAGGWLEALASSPSRVVLALETKRLLAREAGGAWAVVKLLPELLFSRAEPPRLGGLSLTPGERAAVAAEVREVLAETRKRPSRSARRRLRRLLGSELPQDLDDALTRRRRWRFPWC